MMNELVIAGQHAGILHQTAENASLSGQRLVLDGREVLNFGWAGYLGLEQDPRVIDGALEATRRFGVQFASSRGYLSSPLYRTLQDLLDEMFGQPVLIASTTTLGHQSCMPVAMQPDDLVLFDRAAHTSMQELIPTLLHQGVDVEFLPSADPPCLTRRLDQARTTHDKVWYVTDGIYSMHGNFAPVSMLMSMLERHPHLHLYIDDAHAMSWTGPGGTGYAFEQTGGHPRTIVGLSMAKAFGAGGAIFVVPDPDLRHRIRNCGSTMNFSGPIQNPLLGACIASARLHLGGEVAAMQAELRALIAHCRARLREVELAPVSCDQTPILFVEVRGDSNKTFRLVRQLRDRGFFLNFSTFPAVPRPGFRFNVTRYHRPEEIDALVRNLSALLMGEDTH